MATFGRDFVRAATQPAYLQGLFTAAQQVGAAPARRREAQKEAERKTREQGMLSGLIPGSPEYIQQLAKIMEQRGELTQASALGATGIQQQQAAAKAAEEKERKGRLMAEALQKAARSKNPGGEVARVRNMTSEQLMEYLTPKEKELFQLTPGMALIDEEGNMVGKQVPFKPTEPVKPEYDIKIIGEKGKEQVLTFTNGKLTSTTKYEGPRKSKHTQHLSLIHI